MRREMLNKYGKTPGCGGCISIIGGAQQVGHSEEVEDPKEDQGR